MSLSQNHVLNGPLQVLQVAVYLTTWKKIQKTTCAKGCMGFLSPSTILMSNQRHPDKVTLSISIPRDLLQQVRRLAKVRETTVTEIVEYMLWRETNNVVLTPEDYDQIKEERAAYLKRIDRRRKKRAADNSGQKNAKAGT